MVAFGLGKLIDKTIGFRLSEDDEVTGVDQVEHAETAYDFLGASGLRGHNPLARPSVPAPVEDAPADTKEGANA